MYMYKDLKRNYGGNTKIDICGVDRAGKGLSCCRPRNMNSDRAVHMSTDE